MNTTMEYLTIGQFAKRVGLTRGRIHQLCVKNYIKRVPLVREVTQLAIPETEVLKFTGGDLDTRKNKKTRKTVSQNTFLTLPV